MFACASTTFSMLSGKAEEKLAVLDKLKLYIAKSIKSFAFLRLYQGKCVSLHLRCSKCQNKNRGYVY